MKMDWTQVSFAPSSHTAQSVPVYALGKGPELFAGRYDNADISGKLMEARGLAQPR